jgi:hypothetical protein
LVVVSFCRNWKDFARWISWNATSAGLILDVDHQGFTNYTQEKKV